MRAAATLAYDRVARALHWLNACLAAIVILLSFGISATPRHSEAREVLLTLHGSLGLVVLVTMLLWGGWRVRHRSPPLRPMLTRVEVLLAHATQAGVFLLLLLMPLTGYAALAAAGRPVSLFGVVALPTLLPHSDRVAQAALAMHLAGEFLVYALVALHVAAALTHGFIRRDGILERMLPGRTR